MNSSPAHYAWNDVEAEQINASISRRFITADNVTIARFELKRGGVVPEHTHENEQVSTVISGALSFHFGGREMVAGAGEVVRIPGGVPHRVDVLEDALVIDVFSPVRQDWIDGTDTYFERER